MIIHVLGDSRSFSEHRRQGSEEEGEKNCPRMTMAKHPLLQSDNLWARTRAAIIMGCLIRGEVGRQGSNAFKTTQCTEGPLSARQ